LIECDPLVAAAFHEALRQRIGIPRYALWFENKTKLSWLDDQLHVGVPNLFYQEWLERTFADDVRETARDVLGQDMQICFAIDPQLFQAARSTQGETRNTATVAHEAADDGPVAAEAAPSEPARSRTAVETPTPANRAPAARARRWRSLDDFAVGPCNRVAHAAALYTVESTEQGPNPLVVHGPVGTGKTHLLEGIYGGLRRAQPSARIVYTTSEEFTNRFLQAMRTGNLSGFRKHFRDCDVLLFDDLQFLSNKPATQEEFLYTFNALQRDERRVVVSTDCHPRLADQFMPELGDRLMGGAVWGLQPPEQETRLKILHMKSVLFMRERGHVGTPIPDNVLRYLAESLNGNVRELEGALHSLLHYTRVSNRVVDLAAAREVLGDLLRHSVRLVKVSDVDRAVCQVLRLETGALRTKKRGWQLAHPRMLAIYLCRRHTRATYAEIGKHFGGRNHSTAVAAEKKVRQWLQDDEVLSMNEAQLRVRDVLERIERDLLG